MARNQLFRPSLLEQQVFQSLSSEVIYQKGIDVIFLPREIVNLDTIINEDIQSKFSQTFTIEAYDEDIYSNIGKGNLQSSFGSGIFDRKTLMISKETWKELIGNNLTGDASIRPFEGDLIYIPIKKALYQIAFVEHEEPFYNLEFNPFYKLTLEMFEYSQDIFETGNQEIDNFQNNFGYSVVLKIGNGSGNFVLYDEVYQNLDFDEDDFPTVTIHGKITKIENDVNVSKKIITVGNISTNDDVFRNFVSSNNALRKIFKDDDSVSFFVEKVFGDDVVEDIEFEKPKSLPNDPKSDNIEISYNADNLVTSTEKW